MHYDTLMALTPEQLLFLWEEKQKADAYERIPRAADMQRAITGSIGPEGHKAYVEHLQSLLREAQGLPPGYTDEDDTDAVQL